MVKPGETSYEEGLRLLKKRGEMRPKRGGDMMVGLYVWGPARCLVPVRGLSGKGTVPGPVRHQDIASDKVPFICTRSCGWRDLSGPCKEA